MPEIRYLKDKDGNLVYPVTHVDAIFDDNGVNILENISGGNVNLDKTGNNLIPDDKTVFWCNQ